MERPLATHVTKRSCPRRSQERGHRTRNGWAPRRASHQDADYMCGRPASQHQKADPGKSARPERHVVRVGSKGPTPSAPRIPPKREAKSEQAPPASWYFWYVRLPGTVAHFEKCCSSIGTMACRPFFRRGDERSLRVRPRRMACHLPVVPGEGVDRAASRVLPALGRERWPSECRALVGCARKLR